MLKTKKSSVAQRLARIRRSLGADRRQSVERAPARREVSVRRSAVVDRRPARREDRRPIERGARRRLTRAIEETRRSIDRPLVRAGTMSEVRALTRQVEDLRSNLRDVQRSTRRRTISLPGSEGGDRRRGEKVPFMFTKAIRFILTGRRSGNEFEADVLRATEAKYGRGAGGDYVRKTALAEGTDSLGGYLVPAEVVKDLIELIRARAVLTKAGMSILGGLSGSPVLIPKQTGAGTTYWVGEGVAPSESNQTFGQVAATPHEAAHLTKLSKRLIMMASQSAETIVRGDMAAQLSLFLDKEGLRGSGGANAPIGLANTPGILTYAMGTNGDDLSYDHLVGIMQKVRDNDGLTDAVSVGWIFQTTLIGKLMKLRDADDRPLMLPHTKGATEWTGKEPVGSIFGYPVFDTTQLPSNLAKGSGTNLAEIFFGDFATLVMAQWGGMEIEVSDQTSDAFAKRQVWILASQLVDFIVRQEKRLCYVSDAKTV